MRLDKYLADCNIGTRSEIKKMIRSKRVSVNGKSVTEADMHIDENDALITLDGRIIRYEQYRYFLLNKPAGCVSATRDALSDTVIDFLKNENTKDLFPVGRLDKDTEGLLLITNDGVLAHRLLSPGKHVDKLYMAMVDKKLTDGEMKQFAEGLDIGDDSLTLPANISVKCSEGSNTKYLVTIHEGRYHQVKRMFGVFGAEVVYLKRLAMGRLCLPDDLLPGKYLKLEPEAVKKIFDEYED